VVKPQEILWVFEDDAAESERLGAFSDIPPHVRARIDLEVEREIMDLLHLEAVERGAIEAPPVTHFDRMPGKVLRVFFLLGSGAVIGTAAVILALYVLRTYSFVV